jgi:WD40 repeat protein
MKCLEKDRARRYESANGLAMDIKRHLTNEPVVARPPSTAYRFQKAWRRNKVVYTAGVAVAAALMIGMAVSVWQATVARKASQQADTARIAEQEQRIAAQDEAERANLAEQREGLLRHEAEEQELVARRRAYAADMLICKQALKSNNLRRARLLLNRQRPKEGEKDLRGWEWRYLWKQCQGDFLSTLDMQGNRLFNAMFTDDDNSIVTFLEHGRVGVWNDSTGREDFVLQDNWQGDDYNANSGQLEFSADGEWVGAVSKSNTGEWGVRIWNMRNRSLLAELSISQEPITALAVSPDKQWLAVYIQLEEVSVWSLETKQKMVQFPISRRPFAYGIGAVAFSPDGNTLAIGDDETRVRLVDVGTWTEETVLPGSFTGWGVSTLDFSPDGRFLAAGSAYVDPRICIWETQSHRKVATLNGHAGFITDVSFSPDGTRLASASGDQTIKLWNTETWEEVDTLLGHSDEVWSVNFSSDGKRLVSSGKQGQVHIWPATARRQDREAVVLQTGWSGSDLRSGRGEPPDVSPDGRTIVDVSEKGKVRLLEMATLRERPVPDELGDDNFAGVWLSPNEVLIGSRSPLRIKTWNISNNAITTYPLTSQGEVRGFGFSPGSNLLRVGTGSLAAGNFTLTRWDTASRKELASYTVAEPLENVRGLAVSQDGQWLALAHSGQVEVRNMRTGERMPSFKAQSDTLQGLALLSDKLQVVTAGVESPIINVWDFTTQEKLFSLPGHNLVISQIRVSSDERRMASRTIGQEPVKIWDTEGWNEVASIESRPGFSVVGLEFLPDGNTFAVVESNLETQAVDVRLFRAPSLEEIATAEAKKNMGNSQPTAQ